MTLVVAVEAACRDGVGEGEEGRRVAAALAQALAVELVLVVEHRLETLAADVALARPVDRIAHLHVVGGDALGDRARRRPGAKEPAHHLLAGADLGEGAVAPIVEIDGERLVPRFARTRIHRRHEHVRPTLRASRRSAAAYRAEGPSPPRLQSKPRAASDASRSGHRRHKSVPLDPASPASCCPSDSLAHEIVSAAMGSRSAGLPGPYGGPSLAGARSDSDRDGGAAAAAGSSHRDSPRVRRSRRGQIGRLDQMRRVLEADPLDEVRRPPPRRSPNASVERAGAHAQRLRQLADREGARAIRSDPSLDPSDLVAESRQRGRHHVARLRRPAIDREVSRRRHGRGRDSPPARSDAASGRSVPAPHRPSARRAIPRASATRRDRPRDSARGRWPRATRSSSPSGSRAAPPRPAGRPRSRTPRRAGNGPRRRRATRRPHGSVAGRRRARFSAGSARPSPGTTSAS